MADARSWSTIPDAELEAELRGLGRAIAFPAAGPGEAGRPELAVRVRARIAAAPARPGRPGWSWRPARRSLALAVVALLVLATVAAALGLGLPGLRLIFGPPPGSPLPTLEPSATAVPGGPGSSLGLGTRIDPAGLDSRAGFPVRLPADPAVGPPDAAYVDPARNDQVTVAWAPRPGLPPTIDPGVGLLLTQFRGRTDEGFFSKAVDSGTTVERLRVAGGPGYWVSGRPHVYFYQAADGRFIDDARRWVGDALIWSNGEITYRLETALGRDAAVLIAESLE